VSNRYIVGICAWAVDTTGSLREDKPGHAVAELECVLVAALHGDTERRRCPCLGDKDEQDGKGALGPA
jgi:hypothetical protein